MAEDVYARLPSSAFGEDAFREFKGMVIRSIRAAGGDDAAARVHLDVTYFPLPMKLVSKEVFTLPFEQDTPLGVGDAGQFAEGLPPADVGQELDDDEGLTPEGVMVEAAALAALVSSAGGGSAIATTAAAAAGCRCRGSCVR